MTGEVVYFIQAGDDGPIKIGFCGGGEAGVRARLASLQTGNPDLLKVRRIVPGSRLTERLLHQRFAKHRLEGEWFLSAVEVAEEARCPCMKPNHPRRLAMRTLEAAFEAGREVGFCEGESETSRAIKGELEHMAAHWWSAEEADETQVRRDLAEQRFREGQEAA